IKMISNTRSTSMSGVTLMFALWPPLGPTAIPMVVLLYCPAAGGAGGRGVGCFPLLGRKAEIVDSGGPDAIHNLHDAAKTGSHVGFHVHALVRLIGEAIFHVGRPVIDVLWWLFSV